MFDLGWTELLVIGIVALIVVGPKDLPVLFRNVGRFVGKARGMAREFSSAMNEAAECTQHVLGQSGQQEIDTVEATTLGLRFGIEAAVRNQLGRDHLMGVRVGLMGLGSVGFRLAELQISVIAFVN